MLVHRGGDRGIPGSVVEQASLAERATRPDAGDLLAVAMNDARRRRSPHRRRGQARPATTTSTPGGSGHICDAEASCSSTIRGAPTVIGSRSMTASREASTSARFRLSSPSPRRPARHTKVTTTVAMPRTTKLVRSDVPAISTGASTAPSTIAATDRASNTPMTRPSTSERTTRARAVSATTSQATKPAPPSSGHEQRDRELGRPRIHELRGAEHRAGDDDDARDLRARREARVDRRTQQPTQPGDGQQVAVAGGAEHRALLAAYRTS